MKIGQLIATIFLVVLVVAMPVAAQEAITVEKTSAMTTSAVNYLEITSVKINGDVYDDGDRLKVERGEKLDIRVGIQAGDVDVEDAEIEASINGYKYSEYERDLITDYEGPFDLEATDKDYFNLKLQMPVDMEIEDLRDAKLRIRLTDRNNPSVEYLYQLVVYGLDDSEAIQIRDFFISPSETIEAGRALSFKVKVKNMGEDYQDDVKVIVSIPELGLSAYETLDDLDPEDTQSFEALLIRIPTCTDAGQYQVVARVEFDKYEAVEETKIITVVESGSCDVGGSTGDDTKTVVTMPESIEVMKGTSGTVYPILINNKGNSATTYVVSVSGVSEWGTSMVEPSSVVIVKAGEAKTVYVKLNANDDAKVGDKVFQVTLTSGDDVNSVNVVASIKDANGTATEATPLRAVLEWVLIILVIILIIIGIILLVSKMGKDNTGDEDEDAQTYY